MEVNNEQLSLAINSIRRFLINENFFEVHLYSTINYKIENTIFFKLKNNLFLRFNPEPDIWKVGLNHNKFFWIGSMFRNEPKLSPLHAYEFSVTDIYEIGDKETVKKKFIAILKQLNLTSSHIVDWNDDVWKYMIDIDLFILWQEWEVYYWYAKSIRHEYSNYTNENYDTWRLSFLRWMLKKQIFETQYFQEKYEKQARSNIEKEIHLLEKK